MSPQATHRNHTVVPLWLPILAGLPLALCLTFLAMPMLGYGAASVSRTLFLSTFLLWIYPLTLLQRAWWRRGMGLAPLAARLLVATLAMTVMTRALVLLTLHGLSTDRTDAFDIGMIFRGIGGPWLALIAYCAVHAVVIHVAELQQARALQAQALALARDAELATAAAAVSC